tara:strand:- start:14 stop:1570 length:1557 start_codon:yes stop_codon:yes gene_type:complete
MPKKHSPLVLAVLDGWGLSLNERANAIALARTPTFEELLNHYPHSQLITNGEAVGLPPGQMGNSEVGHMNLGSGRIVYQYLTRIDKSIQDATFFSNPALSLSMNRCKNDLHALHLIGLVSDGGVHSHQRHLHALIDMAAQHKVSRVFVHVITDGRDTSPVGGIDFIAALQRKLDTRGVGKIASVSGRYYAMDRDSRWDRTERAFIAMTKGAGGKTFSVDNYIEESYRLNITDEFVEPAVIVNQSDHPVGCIEDGDSVIFFNFRSDRARQLTRALTFENFIDFKRTTRLNIHCTTMTEYDATFDQPVAFSPTTMSDNLAEVLSLNGLRNLRLAETEKYAHVTYFFNGGEEQPYPGEDRILVPSQKVPTYDLKPGMSANNITTELIRDIESGQHDVIVCNFANADMVGHTGKLDAAVEAVATVDQCLAKIVTAVQNHNGTVIVTADHGNAEQMWDVERQGPHTAHTTNPVPLLLINSDFKDRGLKLKNGSLRDVAPTILGLLKIKSPNAMTGTDLREWAR